MQDGLVFTRYGRSPRTVAVLICIYAVLLALILMVDAAKWLMGGLALFTLPALWDLATNPSAGVELDADRLCWHSGRRHGGIDLSEIDHMRFDTRWDFSVRVMAVLKTNRRVRLPFESLPPHKQFETAFQALGIPVARKHFTVF